MKDKKVPIDLVKKQIYTFHGDSVSMQEDTYKGVKSKAVFIDVIYGKWISIVSNVMKGQKHPKRHQDNMKITLVEIKERIKLHHEDTVSIVESTYVDTWTPCTFIDVDFGEWVTVPVRVIRGSKHKKRSDQNRILPLNKLQEKITKIHNGAVVLKPESYLGYRKKVIAIDKDFGEWTTWPASLIAGHSHPKRGLLKVNKSCLKKHWKDDTPISCVGSYESKTVDFLNKHNIEYQWQPKVFQLDSSKYTPDLFLIKENKWVEIKGYFRKDAFEKWTEFQKKHPNSELWDYSRLKQIGIL